MNDFCYNLGVSLAHFSSVSSTDMAHINGQNMQLASLDMPETISLISKLAGSQGSNGIRDALVGMFDEATRLRNIERDYLIGHIQQLEKKLVATVYSHGSPEGH
jgi:hypothetical protein